jgi:hypothetical protein
MCNTYLVLGGSIALCSLFLQGYELLVLLVFVAKWHIVNSSDIHTTFETY